MAFKVAEEYDPLAGISPQEYQRLLAIGIGAPEPAIKTPPPTPRILTPEIVAQVAAQTG